MHRYVLVWLGVFIAFAATFPTAMLRVSQDKKFAGQPVKSLTCEGKYPKVKGVISWAKTCSRMAVKPIKK